MLAPSIQNEIISDNNNKSFAHPELK